MINELLNKNDNKVYAYYEVKGSVLHIKVVNCYNGMNEKESEDYFAAQISFIENNEFSHIAYLNLDT